MKYKNVDEALAAFAAIVPVVPKAATGQIAKRQFKYASLEDILGTINQPLAECELTTQREVTCEGLDRAAAAHVELMSQGVQDAQPRAIVNVTVKVIHLPSSTSRSITLGGLYDAKNPQALGMCITYFWRYALATLLGLQSEEDPDSAGVARSSNDAQQPKASPAQLAEILAALQPAGMTQQKILQALQLNSMEDIPATMVPGILERLRARAKRIADNNTNGGEQ